MYYKGALGALMVFDANKLSTLKVLDKWIKELEKGTERGIVPFIIIGNKMDLITEATKKKIRTQVNTLIKPLNAKYSEKGFTVDYFETSAKNNENVSDAFESLGLKIIDYINYRKEQRRKGA
jgi:GTPase SAR1 family protein